MEFEAVDEGTVAKILIAEGTDEVKVGTVIALIAAEGEDAGAAAAGAGGTEPVASDGGETGAGQPATPTPTPEIKGYGVSPAEQAPAAAPAAPASPAPAAAAQPRKDTGDRVKASPLARRLAEQRGVDLSALTGSGPGGRIVKADVDGAGAGGAAKPRQLRLPPPHLLRRQRLLRRRPRVARRPRHPARGGQAFQHPQDDRAAPHRIEAAGPAHLLTSTSSSMRC
jgi:pyruvate dehydrogenase E2 component (dihydrolipoamide acetyltransferase)